MPIALRDDVMYILLEKIGKASGDGKQAVDFQAADFTGRDLTISDFLGHLDYLNQKQYIDADFTGNAYGTQEDVPNAVNIETDKLDFRVANTFGAPDGPLPHLIKFERAELTEKGKEMLERMEQKLPAELMKGPATPIVDRDTAFLEKVVLKGELPDIFEARDITTVVYRTLRDLMTTEAAKAVEADLHNDATRSSNARLPQEIAELWRDSNPLVQWLSSVRPPLKIDADTFLFRIKQEGGIPRGTTSERVITAIFSATKEELPEDRAKQVADCLPGKIKEMWQAA
ncbi:hypothetical protein C1752_04049 [Acaryochloris thomasi RCC1774]|uniref:DUF2267 domain-containing protein n=1 Tax=Acaryochloris thomasi RCC1774 TaxID=1764569 RepID=A0A2W1JMG5_9CYAN|nr:DUF2267 domain-containing protein [Acaryochloris thomasi]PZD72072.1 hypothetical protein C1752_04049 [Acaryochloris thomasi RCC1774]